MTSTDTTTTTRKTPPQTGKISDEVVSSDISSSSSIDIDNENKLTSDAHEPQHPSSTLGYTTYTIDNGSFPWRDVTVLSQNSSLYFADVSQYTPRTPDMVWRSRDKTGPVIGHTFIHLGRSIKCGLGPDEPSMTWVEMRRSGFTSSKSYKFEWGGKVYVICRTSGSGAKSGMYSVLEEGTKEVVARHEGEFTKLGARREKKVEFREGVGEDLRLLILMGVCAWREKSRRKRNAANRQPY